MRDLPQGWAWTTLGEVADYTNGRGFKKSEWSTSGRPIIRIQNLTGTSSSFNFFEGEPDAKHLIKTNDLLVSWAATLAVHRWLDPREGALNQHIFKVEPRPVVDDRFLEHTLRFALEDMHRKTHGSGMVHITRGKFDATRIPLPPLAEQRRIVEALEDHLSRLDAAQRYLHSAVSRLNDMDRASLDRHFGRREVPLGELIEGISAGKSFGGTSAPAKADEWGIIKVSAMTWGQFAPSENKAISADLADPRFEIHEGDLLVSRANTEEYVGASVLVGQVRQKLLLSDKSLRITPRRGVRASWLWRALQAPSSRSQISELATGTKDSMRNISQDSLRRILLPSADADEQDTTVQLYEEAIEAIRRARAEVGAAQSRANALGRSLLHAAFNGELVEQDPNDEPADVVLARIQDQPKPTRKRPARHSPVSPKD